MLRILAMLLAAGLIGVPNLWATDYVVVVLDDSGSMNDTMARQNLTRMMAAKQALTTVLDILPDDTHVGIVLLNGRLKDNPWVIPLGPVDMSQVRELLAQVPAGGGTQLGRFLKVGADELLARRAKEHYGTYRLLVVTDGEANDPELVERYLPDILSRGLALDVIGVDMDQRHSLATKVHSYRQADNPESLTQAISEVFAETSAATDADASDFDLLEFVSPEMAEAALEALAATGNEEIGATIGAATDAGSSDAAGSSGQPQQRKNSGIPVIVYLIVAVVLWSFISKLFKSRRR